MKQLFGLIIALTLLLASAGSAGAQAQTAQVRFLHTAVDVAPVDVLVDGKQVAQAVKFADVTGYIEVPAGDHTLTLQLKGQSQAAAFTSKLTVGAGKAYTVAAAKQSEMRIQLIEDDLSVPTAGKARVRLTHLSPDAPSVDLEVIGGQTLFSGIGFGQNSGYKLVDAGVYNLRAVAAGEATVFIQLPNTQLQSGKIYDVFAVGRLATLWAQVAEVTPAAPTAPAVTKPSAPAPAAPATVPRTMPNTAGASAAEQAAWLLVLVPALLAVGFGLRRKARM